MKIAILGIPQAGKKTLFSLLTKKSLPEFLKTGETLKGLAKVHDIRVEELTKMYNPKKTIFAETELVLCPDIEMGSNNYSWLNEARMADLLCFVIRDFISDDVFHPEGSIDSLRDIDNIKAEIILSDLALIETRLERIKKEKVKKKQGAKQLTEEKTLEKFKLVLEDDKFLNTMTLSKDEMDSIQSLNFITLKTILWCNNIHEDNIADLYQKSSGDIFYISALIEKEISEIEDEGERVEYMEELSISEAGINRLNQTAYDLLGLMSFYTVGEDEVRAWTIKKETFAPKAGGKIHSDIERGFIRVEVMKYDDLLCAKDEQTLKAQGKMGTKGKDYIISDGDICHFLFNV